MKNTEVIKFNVPILILAWRRAIHLRQVIQSLKLINAENLYVVVDGPRFGANFNLDVEQISETVDVIESEITWPCNVTKLYRDINFGCGLGVSSAITWFFNQVDYGIILEEDCVPNMSFFNFCEQMLEKYHNEERIMHIGGQSFGVNRDSVENPYFFSSYNHIWGWATWRRSWNKYEYQLSDKSKEKVILNLTYYFDTLKERNYWIEILNRLDEIDTWDYQWTFTIWANNGLAILPNRNLVKNIGFDSMATHTSQDNLDYNLELDFSTIELLELKNNQLMELNKSADIQISNNNFNINAIQSPITKKDNVKLMYEIPVERIIKLYSEHYNINVSRYFNHIRAVKVFKCLDSGYRFYFPLDLSGTGDFYSQLQQFEWYYMPWKWEHQVTSGLISNGMKILEVGCGSGDFLHNINNQFEVQVVGLELNASAVETAIEKGLDVHLKTVEEFSVNHSGHFDLVCAFEVLEHIADIHSFLSASVRCLKKDGKLVVAVPNNDSFIKYSRLTNILNMPPHHMGLWDQYSLKKIEDYFDLKFEYVRLEPIQLYHKKWYKEIINGLTEVALKKLKLTKIFEDKAPFILKGMRKLIFIILSIIFSKKGHTVLAVFTKK